MGKTIIVLATGQGYEDCPNKGEIWTINHGYKYRKCKKVFITDKQYTDEPGPNFDVEAMNELKSSVVSLNHIEGLRYEPYPLKEIVAKFGIEYFANSICYLFAYGLYYGIKDFICYGFVFSEAREIVEQKPCIEYWIGRITGAGGTVQIKGDTVLLKHFRGLPYGFNYGEHEYKVDAGNWLPYWHYKVEEEHYRIGALVKQYKTTVEVHR